MPMVTGRSQSAKVVGSHVFLIAFLCVVLFPVVYVFFISMRRGNLVDPGNMIPDEISWEHWQKALGITYIDDVTGQKVPPPFPVLTWIWNSVMISFVSSALIVILSTSCAYAFARLRFAYKSGVLYSLLILQMFPMVLALVAIYAILDFLGAYLPAFGLDTHGGIILAYMGGISMNIWMIKGYFENIPASMEESAGIDGASKFQAFVYILLPMSYPILAVVFILSFIYSFGEFPVATVVLQTESKMTLAVGLRFFLQEQNFLWGDFAAAAILGGLPITVMFLFCQRFLVSGLTAGGAKE